MELKWSEINRWSKNLGYKISKKDQGYFWVKLSDENKFGESNSLFLVTKQIFNDHTNNKWIEHQNNYSGLVK